MIIPFFIPHAGCPHQCVFCNQKRITGASAGLQVSLIPRTINTYLATHNSNVPAQVAFYGGSFTALPLDVQTSCLEAVQPFIGAGRIAGIRLSTRPDGISTKVLDLLEHYHVRTVELGVQSLDNRVLALSGRGHSAEQTRDAVIRLRRYRFMIGIQLMPGLPGDSAELFQNTVQQAITLEPNFVRLYPALVIRDTPLETLFRAGLYPPLSLDDAVLLSKEALLAFERAGIDVIRIGLQPSEELEKAGTVIAGPYHPAFRQLVESSILLDRMREKLKGIVSSRDVTFLVNPRDVSNAIGQKRSNIDTLRQELGVNITVRPAPAIPARNVEVLCSSMPH
jgi:histone acetyltransferase (RNA polymerase elongator complex component)